MTQVATMPNVTSPAPAATPDATPTPTPAAPRKRGPRGPDQTKIFPTKDAAMAEKQPKGLRRYGITAPDGKESFIHAREPRSALSTIAINSGWKIVNLDGGDPFGRNKSIEQRLELLTPDERNALLAKYIPGYKPDAVAANRVANVAATAPGNAARKR